MLATASAWILDCSVTSVLFFGHDAYDAAVQRRIKSLIAAGADVTGLTMRRGPPGAFDWTNIDLGETRHADYRQRLTALWRALPALQRETALTRGAEILWARNFDMLALALYARAQARSRAAVVYECLDVHPLMLRRDAVGWAFRVAEGAMLERSCLLVVSSPGFLREYFERHHAGRYRAQLMENRIPADLMRPLTARPPRDATDRLRIGYTGFLRCRRSMRLLGHAAEAAGGRVEVMLRGYAAPTYLPDFDDLLAQSPGLTYGGRYAYPDDLPQMYASMDLVWAGDFSEAGANSDWLLPNRLYEGGAYGAVPVAPAASEAGRWIAARGAGFVLPEPLEETLPAFLTSVTHAAIAGKRAAMAAQPADTFITPVGETADLLARLVARNRSAT
jgi:succinoglycan biosynthesis protein ExoL